MELYDIKTNDSIKHDCCTFCASDCDCRNKAYADSHSHPWFYIATCQDKSNKCKRTRNVDDECELSVLLTDIIN